MKGHLCTEQQYGLMQVNNAPVSETQRSAEGHAGATNNRDQRNNFLLNHSNIH